VLDELGTSADQEQDTPDKPIEELGLDEILFGWTDASMRYILYIQDHLVPYLHYSMRHLYHVQTRWLAPGRPDLESGRVISSRRSI
jgi:hypothetical protein